MRRVIIDHGIDYREDKYRHDPELREAYECGVKEGWRQAMEEQYGERNRNYNGYGERHMPYEHRGNMMYREMPPMYREDDPDYEERRRRRANGRFY